MTKSTLWIAGLCALMLCSAQPAGASMIGDSITVNRFYPDLATIYTPPADAIPGTVTVVAKVGPDAASPQPNHYSIDLEANSIAFDFLNSSSFAGKVGPVYSAANPFDGLQFLGFSSPILNVSVGSVSGISVVELLFGTNFINLNLDGAFTGASSLTLQVEFGQASTAVPEPSTLSLLGISLALGHLRRRRAR